MSAPHIRQTDAESSSGCPRVQSLTDEFIESYVCWREECVLLEEAYETWRTAPLADRGLAFAAYTAALDREQQAASVLRTRAERLRPIPRDRLG